MEDTDSIFDCIDNGFSEEVSNSNLARLNLGLYDTKCCRFMVDIWTKYNYLF